MKVARTTAEEEHSGRNKTERPATQAEADRSRRTEEYFRHLVEDINDVLFALREDGTIDYISPALRALAGYLPEDVLGHNFAEFVHPDDLVEVVESFQRVVAGAVEPSEFRVLHKNGSVRWVRSSSRYAWMQDDVRVTCGVLTDVTERKRALESLRTSEKRFRALCEHSSDLVTLMDEGGVIRYVSPNVRRMLGWNDHELIGRNGFDAVHPEDVEVLFAAFKDLLHRPGTTTMQVYRYRHKNGSWRWMEGVGTNVLGDIEGGAVIVNNRDITDRHRAEEAARQHQAELAHVLRLHVVNEMASVLAHEINQPLAAIVNYARGSLLRLNRGDTAGEIKQALEEIADQGLRLGEIVRSLKRLVRKEPPRDALIDLNRLVENVLHLIESEARSLGVTLRCRLADDLPNIRGDAVQLEQVILNLLRNGIEAVQSGDQGGTISVETARCDESTVRVAVVDTGVGLPEGGVEKIFEPFFTTKASGLGMGLSITRTIVEAHGGCIRAKANEQGRGTNFRVTFPVASS